jgi:hypothetical protein
MLARQTTRAPAAAARAHLPPPSRLPALGNQTQLRRLQAKLTIGAVNDPLEHEADKAADHVMRMTDPGMKLTAAPPRLSRKCAACEEDNAHMQRQPAGPAPQAASGAAPGPLVQDTLSRPGQKLDPATRAFFEPRFGRSLDAIRVHTDERAAASAQAVGAAAYAVGPQIVFGANRYQPGTAAGRHLLAHELAHTIQQSGPEPALRRQPAPAPGGPGPGGPAPAAAAHVFRAEGVRVSLHPTCNTTPGFTFAIVEAAVRDALNKIFHSTCIDASHRTAIQANLIKNGFEFRARDSAALANPGACAEGTGFSIPANIVTLGTAALDPAGCGPLASTVLHEMIHIIRGFFAEALPRSCEASCYGQAGDPTLCRDTDVTGHRHPPPAGP